MEKDKLIEYIKSLRDNALKNYTLSERGIITLKEMEEAEEDLLANYYEDDTDFIMSRIADISEHYIEQQEYLYYQGFLDGMENQNLNGEQLKIELQMLRG